VRFTRAQFTPDLLPADLTGSFVFDQRGTSSCSVAARCSHGLLLADEINRTPPKTQAALLEAMQESQITVEARRSSWSRRFTSLPRPTRRNMRALTPYPRLSSTGSCSGLVSVTRRRTRSGRCSSGACSVARKRSNCAPSLTRQHFLAMQAAVETVVVDDDVGRYCVDLVVPLDAIRTCRSGPRRAVR